MQDEVSLFSEEEINNTTKEVSSENKKRITVTNVNFINQVDSSIEDVFCGFDELKAITYSYTVSFIAEIMKNFKSGEVIFGAENLIKKDLARLFAAQKAANNDIKKNSYLQNRMNKDEFQPRVLKELVSHEKVYLLKSNDNRFRVVLGSANFSRRAWGGKQRESFIVCDDKEAYDRFLEQYEELRKYSTTEITKDAVLITSENIEDIPTIKEIIETDTSFVFEAVEETPEQKTYIIDIDKNSEEYKEILKQAKIQKDKKGATLIAPKHVVKLIQTNKEKKKEEEDKPEKIHFKLDFYEKTAAYNNINFDLNPNEADVKKDIKNLLLYMDGYSNFTKDTSRLKRQYWKALNYIFLSPFIARLRYEAEKFSQRDERLFPMYMLIYGSSDAGKTAFINMTQQLMFEDSRDLLSQDDWFSNEKMTYLKNVMKGYPLAIDEITSTKWKYVDNIVKKDDDLLKQEFINHSVFVFLSNNVDTTKYEISKRVIVIKLDNQLTRKKAVGNGKNIKILMKNMTNAFYRKYLSRMFVAVDDLIKEMEENESVDTKEWVPDIFNVSANIIIALIKEAELEVPNELEQFNWEDYTGDSAIGELTSLMLKTEFSENPDMFNVNRKENILTVDFSNYSDKSKARKKLKTLENELPANLECKVIGDKATMYLSETERFIGTSFEKKKNFLQKIFG